VEPSLDIFEELWQYSHVTVGFVGRVLIAAGLLAYGMVKGKILFMIAGLLFLPLLPLLMAISFGACTRTWRLSAQGALAFLIAISLCVASGMFVALMTEPPLLFDDKNPLITTFLISLAVGVAAGLATGDDAAERQLLGLAATAQLVIVPVWFGIMSVFDRPNMLQEGSGRALSLGLNLATILAGALVTYTLLRFKGEGLRRFLNGKKPAH
jgi:hypothetical protein